MWGEGSQSTSFSEICAQMKNTSCLNSFVFDDERLGSIVMIQ